MRTRMQMKPIGRQILFAATPKQTSRPIGAQVSGSVLYGGSAPVRAEMQTSHAGYIDVIQGLPDAQPTFRVRRHWEAAPMGANSVVTDLSPPLSLRIQATRVPTSVSNSRRVLAL